MSLYRFKIQSQSRCPLPRELTLNLYCEGLIISFSVLISIFAHASPLPLPPVSALIVATAMLPLSGKAEFLCLIKSSKLQEERSLFLDLGGALVLSIKISPFYLVFFFFFGSAALTFTSISPSQSLERRSGSFLFIFRRFAGKRVVRRCSLPVTGIKVGNTALQLFAPREDRFSPQPMMRMLPLLARDNCHANSPH